MSLQWFRLIWTFGVTATGAIFCVSLFKPEKWLWLVLIPFLLMAVLSMLPLFLGDGLWGRSYYFRMVRQFIGSYLIPVSLLFFIIHIVMFSVKSLSLHVVSREECYYAVNGGLFLLYAVSLIALRIFLRNRYPVPGVDYE